MRLSTKGATAERCCGLVARRGKMRMTPVGCALGDAGEGGCEEVVMQRREVRFSRWLRILAERW